jgi:hypothetical protein
LIPPSRSNVLENVYDASNCSSLLSCLLITELAYSFREWWPELFEAVSLN